MNSFISVLAVSRGEKSNAVIDALNNTEGEFTLREIELKCPSVSRETIKAVLKRYPECFVCSGRGISARWRRRLKVEG